MALQAKIAYYTVLLAQQYLDTHQKRVDESKERVRIAQESFEQGRIAKFDLLRNQTALAEAEQILTNALKDSQIAIINLRTVMGVSPESNISVRGEMVLWGMAGTLAGLRSIALSQRPELAAARAEEG